MTSMPLLADNIASAEDSDVSTNLFPPSVLTGPGGRYELREDVRQLCALTSDGRLHVSAQHQADPYVMAFMDQLEHAGVDFQVVICSLTDIKALYRNTGTGLAVVSVDTDRQAQAIALLREAHRRGASDVHIVVGHDITRVLCRVHGLLWEMGQEKSSDGMELCSALYNGMCDVTRDHGFQPHFSQDARVRREFVEQLGLFGARLATRPLVDGPLMIIRLLSDDPTKMSMDELGFLPEQNALFARLRSLPYGVNLITGPTGSGKSKTLQVNIDLLAKECNSTKHILTVEDPPEYPIRGNQSPLNPNETWDSAITNSMRLDPDILLYGEIRDLASARAVFRGGMTGHQVWSTLHTNNAVASLQRLVDMGVDQHLVVDPALMTGIINQSLLPVLCPQCRIPATQHPEKIEANLRHRLQKLRILEHACLKGSGCSACKGLGVVDRTVVAEVLLPDLLFMKVFAEQGASAARRHWVREMGGITKIAHAITKIAQGLIDPQHAERIIGPLDFDQQVLELSHAH